MRNRFSARYTLRTARYAGSGRWAFSQPAACDISSLNCDHARQNDESAGVHKGVSEVQRKSPPMPTAEISAADIDFRQNGRQVSQSGRVNRLTIRLLHRQNGASMMQAWRSQPPLWLGLLAPPDRQSTTLARKRGPCASGQTTCRFRWGQQLLRAGRTSQRPLLPTAQVLERAQSRSID